MGECELCDGDDDFSNKCNHCGGIYCNEHRLPEQHNCTGLAIDGSVVERDETIAIGGEVELPYDTVEAQTTGSSKQTAGSKSPDVNPDGTVARENELMPDSSLVNNCGDWLRKHLPTLTRWQRYRIRRGIKKKLMRLGQFIGVMMISIVAYQYIRTPLGRVVDVPVIVDRILFALTTQYGVLLLVGGVFITLVSAGIHNEI